MNKDCILFKCKKCNHLLYREKNIEEINTLLNYHCPNCGEDDEIWVLIGEGNRNKFRNLK